MIKNGFKTLQIINSGDRAYERLNNLENILNQILQISKKELENHELSAEDYDFINNFAKQINFVTGDVKKENLHLKNGTSFPEWHVWRHLFLYAKW